MSGLDQPIVIANSCYHVGHERSVRVAEEQGFFQEEGLERHVYERGGLIPGPWEAVGLARQMWERGVDIATAVDVRAAILQRARREDVFIVGGWRTIHPAKLIAAQGITRPEQLRGGKTITREDWGLAQAGIVMALRAFGIGPGDVEWIEGVMHPELEAQGADLLRTGQVTFYSANGRDARALMSEGYPLVLDTAHLLRHTYGCAHHTHAARHHNAIPPAPGRICLRVVGFWGKKLGAPF
jgi:ABC-type nitrate/sulfonate/bicarbonate transport system substrate-binding protein